MPKRAYEVTTTITLNAGAVPAGASTFTIVTSEVEAPGTYAGEKHWTARREKRRDKRYFWYLFGKSISGKVYICRDADLNMGRVRDAVQKLRMKAGY